MTPVLDVLGAMRASRRARLVRRFVHGAGGTSLVELDGRRVVLKAWPPGSPVGANLELAFRRMEVMRGRGVPIPAPLEDGELAGRRYVVYEYVPGRWPPRVTASLLDELIEVVDAERGAAPGEGRDWGARLRSALFDADPTLDVAPAALEGHPAGRGLLLEARARLDACADALPAGDDIVHCDFAPENALTRAGHLCGVVDWEHCRAGDARFDLVGLLFDMEAGPKSTAQVSRRLRRALAERLPLSLLAAYVSFYAVRYASWAIGTYLEDEVLALADRLAHAYLDEIARDG